MIDIAHAHNLVVLNLSGTAREYALSQVDDLVSAAICNLSLLI